MYPQKGKNKKENLIHFPTLCKKCFKKSPQTKLYNTHNTLFLLHVQVQKYRVAHFQRLNVLPSPRNILLAGRLRYRHFKLFPSVHITPFSVVPFIFQPPQDYSLSLQMSYTITSIMNGEFESSKALVNGHVIQEYQDECNGFILFLKTRRCRVSTAASPRYFFNAKAINLVQPKGILGSHVNPSEGLSLLLSFGGWKGMTLNVILLTPA